MAEYNNPGCSKDLPDHFSNGSTSIPIDQSYVKTFFHCSRCISEIPAGESPRDWARLEVGFTDIGIQVWCIRHDTNVVHIDFEGSMHPFNA